MPSIIEIAWKRYLRQLRERPLETKAVTSGVLAGISDLIAQRIARGTSSTPLQWRKTILMALFGFIYGGPSAHYVHKLLDRVFHYKRDVSTVVKKVFVEQLTYGPICNVAFLAWITAIIERQSLSAVHQKIRRDYVGVQLNGWKVWPLAALVNYKFVPPQLRVLFLNCVAMFWSTFLILQTRQKQALPRSLKAV